MNKMNKITKHDTIIKTIDEFIRKYPPPVYTYIIQTSMQTQDSKVMEADLMLSEVKTLNSHQATNFTISSIA